MNWNVYFAIMTILIVSIYGGLYILIEKPFSHVSVGEVWCDGDDIDNPYEDNPECAKVIDITDKWVLYETDDWSGEQVRTDSLERSTFVHIYDRKQE